MDKKSPSLCSRLERAITSFLYNGTAGRSRAWSMGLQLPLWLWTHQIAVESERTGREMQKVVNLIHWFHDNGANVAQVAIILPGEMRPRLRDELVPSLRGGTQAEELALPTLLAPHELTVMNTRGTLLHQYEVVVYVFAFPPVSHCLSVAMQQEQFIGDAIAGAKGAFILIADVGWTSPHLTTHWPQWKTFVMKLEEEKPLISSEEKEKLPSDARFPSLVGSYIPLSCARHVEQRQLEHGLAPIARSCKRLCLQPFLCQRDGHVCTEPCHPRVRHTNCPYACQTNMPCGHECLESCSERCNCFEVHEHPLSCSHTTVIGLDKVTMQPIYAEVHHVFKGYCADAELPCVVEYATDCARCLGPMMTTCSEARQQNHTLEHRTLICSSCIRLEREVRAKILGEILVKTEEAKRQMKVDMQRTLHQQRKASSQGLFQEGSRVTICDVLKIVKPLCADVDFPGVKFADYDSPDFYSSMDGAYGTFVSRHVDVDDLSEVRNLIRLRDGEHVLVADGGVRLIRALTSTITQQVPALLLTYNNTSNSNNVSGGGSGGNGQTSSLNDSVALAKSSKMIGRRYYLPIPVPCGGGTISDKIVRVTAVDPVSPDSVIVECCLTSVIQHADEGHDDDDNNNNEGSCSLQAKKVRLEGSQAQTQTPHLRAFTERLTFSAPVASLEPIDAYVPDKEVIVLDPTRQVTNPHDVEIFEAVLNQTPDLDLKGSSISTVSVGKDTSFILLGIVNSPSNLEKKYGPCAVLRRHVRLITVRSGRRGKGGSCGRRPSAVQHVANISGESSDATVVVVPFVFTAADELLEAENSLDAAALERFERQVRETIAERSDELAIRHDEEAFHQQRQMPAAAEHHGERTALSVPVPLPAAEALAAVRTRQVRLLRASPLSLRLSRQRDAVALRQQQIGLAKWVEAVESRGAREREADAAYCKGLQLKAAATRR